MKTICICNQKGGVAKTTTAVNLAAILAGDFGKRVLVIDADSQGNATSFLGGDRERVGVAAMLRRELSDEKPLELQTTNVPGVSLIAGSPDLMDLDLSKAGDGRADVTCLRELRKALEQREEIAAAVKGDERNEKLAAVIYGEPFDFCIVDCPPAFNAASSAALIAADAVLIPVKLDAFALEGMTNLMRQIANMRRLNPKLQLLGVLPVMWYRSDTITKAESALRSAGLKVLPRIRRSDRVDDMTYFQQPLIVCSPRSAPCRDYRNLATWIVGQERRDTSSGAAGAAPPSPQGEGKEPEPLRGHDVAPGKRRGRPKKSVILSERSEPKNLPERPGDPSPAAQDDMQKGGAQA